MSAHRHFKIFKPYGMLSLFVYNQPTRRNKRLLGELHDFPTGIMAIGRLDEQSEGLLLLTTDGKVSEQIRSASVEKEYHVMVDGMMTEHAILGLKTGVLISVEGKQFSTTPCDARLLNGQADVPAPGRKLRDERHGPTSWIAITLTEGKFRQVRKMTAAVGFPTLRLVRVRVGDHHLDGMQPGEVVELKSLIDPQK